MSLRTLFWMTAIGVSLAACAGDDDETDDGETDDTAGETDTNTGPDLVAGAQTYGSSCAGCHGAQGQGTGFGPDLGERVPGKSQADVEGIIKNGSGNMSAISGLDATEVTNVAAYVIDQHGN